MTHRQEKGGKGGAMFNNNYSLNGVLGCAMEDIIFISRGTTSDSTPLNSQFEIIMLHQQDNVH